MTSELGLDTSPPAQNVYEVIDESEYDERSNPNRNATGAVEIKTPPQIIINKNVSTSTRAISSESHAVSQTIGQPKVGQRVVNGKILIRASSVLNPEMVSGKPLERWKMVRKMVNNKTLAGTPVPASLTTSPVQATLPPVNKWKVVQQKVNDHGASFINAEADKWKVIQRVVNQKILVRSPPSGDSEFPIDKRRVLVRGSSFIDGM